jgi:uncharacterized protein YbjT (DUF2867 family)
MRTACTGVTTLLLVSAREAADRPEQHKIAVDAAVDAGVERIVYLSFIGAARDATFTFARDHFHTEQHIRASGAAWTFSRQNLYMDLLPLIAGQDGAIRGPAGDGRVAPVLRDDVADALRAIVTEAGHEGMTYELTGPDAITLAEAARALTTLANRPVSSPRARHSRDPAPPPPDDRAHSPSSLLRTATSDHHSIRRPLDPDCPVSRRAQAVSQLRQA